MGFLSLDPLHSPPSFLVALARAFSKQPHLGPIRPSPNLPLPPSRLRPASRLSPHHPPAPPDASLHVPERPPRVPCVAPPCKSSTYHPPRPRHPSPLSHRSHPPPPQTPPASRHPYPLAFLSTGKQPLPLPRIRDLSPAGIPECDSPYLPAFQLFFPRCHHVGGPLHRDLNRFCHHLLLEFCRHSKRSQVESPT